MYIYMYTYMYFYMYVYMYSPHPDPPQEAPAGLENLFVENTSDGHCDGRLVAPRARAPRPTYVSARSSPHAFDVSARLSPHALLLLCSHLCECAFKPSRSAPALLLLSHLPLGLRVQAAHAQAPAPLLCFSRRCLGYKAARSAVSS